jgi:hypothetical protein
VVFLEVERENPRPDLPRLWTSPILLEKCRITIDYQSQNASIVSATINPTSGQSDPKDGPAGGKAHNAPVVDIQISIYRGGEIEPVKRAFLKCTELPSDGGTEELRIEQLRTVYAEIQKEVGQPIGHPNLCICEMTPTRKIGRLYEYGTDPGKEWLKQRLRCFIIEPKPTSAGNPFLARVRYQSNQGAYSNDGRALVWVDRGMTMEELFERMSIRENEVSVEIHGLKGGFVLNPYDSMRPLHHFFPRVLLLVVAQEDGCAPVFFLKEELWFQVTELEGKKTHPRQS